MPSPINFPTKPFYIMSRLDNSNWVLTLTPQGAVVMRHLTSTNDQLWKATPDPRGGSFLTHVGTGLVLAYQLQRSFPEGETPGGPLLSANLDTADPKQLWRCEDLGFGSSGINAFLDWERKINIYHSDPNGTVGLYKWDNGSNEKWILFQEAGESK